MKIQKGCYLANTIEQRGVQYCISPLQCEYQNNDLKIVIEKNGERRKVPHCRLSDIIKCISGGEEYITDNVNNR